MPKMVKHWSGRIVFFGVVGSVLLMYLKVSDINYTILFSILGVVFFGISQVEKPPIVTHTLSTPNEDHLSIIKKVIFFNQQIFFPFLLCTYMFALLAQKIGPQEGIIFSFATLVLAENILLILLITSALFVGILEQKEKHTTIISSWRTGGLYFFIVALAFLGSWIIFFQTNELQPWLQVGITCISGVMIYVIGMLIVEDDEKTEEIQEQGKKLPEFDI